MKRSTVIWTVGWCLAALVFLVGATSFMVPLLLGCVIVGVGIVLLTARLARGADVSPPPPPPPPPV